MSNIPWQGVRDLANMRQQEMRAEAASWRMWRELRRGRREAKREQRPAARSSPAVAQAPAANQAVATMKPVPAHDTL